jgi:hypothetical protein
MADHLIRSAAIDFVERELVIDGVRFPFIMAVDGPRAEVTDDEATVIVNVPLLVAGPVVVRPKGDGPVEVYDPVLGNVADFTTKMVRDAFAEAFPWLEATKEN